MTTIKDALPPEDGWVGILVPLQDFPLITPEAMQQAINGMGGKTVEGTLSGVWDDMDPEP